MVRFRGLSLAGTAYLSAVIVLGVLIVPVGLLAYPASRSQFPVLLYLAGFTQIAALLPIRWRYGVQTLHTLPLVAAALLSPGIVPLMAWICVYDGRRPSKDVPLWRLINARATIAIAMGFPALLAAHISVPGQLLVPIRTTVISLGVFAITNLITAGAFAFLLNENYWRVLAANVGLRTARMLLIVCYGGGVLYMTLQLPGGYLMGVGLLALIIAVRSNMTDADRQDTERVQTLELLAQALDARDPLTELHSQRVAELAGRLAAALELSHLEVDRLRMAGLLHDIGKIGVRDSILKKPSHLNAEEWEEMRAHAGRGADMIAGHTALEPLAPWVRYHHERMDGSGYPSGKVGDEIPLGARILAVADSYDTITGPRVYRAHTMTPRDAVIDISGHTDDWYDPVVVDALRSLHSMPPLKRRQPPLPLQPKNVASGLHIFRERRPFALLAGGMAISSLGDPLTTVALVVTVYAITGNPIAVAAIYGLKGVTTVLAGSILGGAVDGWDRRRVIVGTDLTRAVTLIGVPIAVHAAVWTIFAAVVVLAGAEALGQSARDAAIPELIGKGEITSANALIGTAVMVSGAVGYPLAAGLLLVSNSSTTPLFLFDGLTFAAAALLSLGIGRVGGGIVGRRLTGALRSAWSVPTARSPLLLAGATALFASMTYPTIVLLAYQLSAMGASAFTGLELLITLGMIVGTVLLTWRRHWSPARSTILGLLLMGGFSVGVAVSPWLAVTAVLLFIASAGNMIYAIGNRSTLQQAAVTDHRGSVMVVRFMVTQSMVVVGSTVGGVLAARVGPRGVYAVIGAGTLILAAVTLAKERSKRVSQPQDKDDDIVDNLTPVPLSRAPSEYAERA